MSIRILEICAKLNIGGAQLVAANISRYAPDGFDITYLVYGDEVGEYEAAICERGHHVIRIPSPRRNTWSYLRRLTKLMREGRYDVVHCHTMFSSGVAMLAAWLAGVRGRICHSHTAKDDTGRSLPRRAYRAMMRGCMRLFATDYLACGVDAGRELYGKKLFDRHGRVIRNGIDIWRFAFSKAAREEVRREYGVENCFVIGHAGHYVPVKNQSFLISLLSELRKTRPDAVLMMFGEGEDRPALQVLIDEAHLQSSARLMGNVNNIDKVLSAMDVFAFPSLFEGTPLALIEAQANGLPCIISDRIPQDACLTELIKRIPLEDRASWIGALGSASRDFGTDWGKTLADRYETVETSMDQLYRIFAQYQT